MCVLGPRCLMGSVASVILGICCADKRVGVALTGMRGHLLSSLGADGRFNAMARVRQAVLTSVGAANLVFRQVPSPWAWRT